MNSIIQHILKRKMVSGVIALALIGGGYFCYTTIFSNDGVVRYATAQVQNGTLIVSISGSGQVFASNQVDVKPKASGDVVYIGVKNGQEVKAGALIVQLDAKDAQKAVRDAEINLESEQLALEKLKIDTNIDVTKAYDSVFGTLSDVFGELPKTLDTLSSIFTESSYDGDSSDIDYYSNLVNLYDSDSSLRYSRRDREVFQRAYLSVERKSEDLIIQYRTITKASSLDEIRTLLENSYNIAEELADLVRSGRDMTLSYQRHLGKNTIPPILPTTTDAQLASLNSLTNTLNQDVVNLLLAHQTIDNAVIDDKRTTISNAGLNLRSREIAVRERENALLDAKNVLANYFIRAPFDGVIAKLDAKEGDSVSSATILGTLITKQKIAEVSLNEIDVAQIKAGQKATLTFDAIPDLTISGQVAEVDAVGTVSQGVVTYNIKIGFDTQDERVKTAMSASAAIVTEAKPNVLLVPNSAVKSQGGVSYVEVPDEFDMSVATANVSNAVFKNPTRQQQIEVGTANDEFTEIISGLNEGDLIVTRTIQSTAQTTQTQQQSGGLRIPGLPGGGGGFRGGGGAPR